MSKKLFVGFSVVVILGMLLAACGTPANYSPGSSCCSRCKTGSNRIQVQGSYYLRFSHHW